VCGIIGLYAKAEVIQHSLGKHMAAMLAQMGERGPDSAGIAIYNDASVGPDGCKLTLQHDSAKRLGEIKTEAATRFPGSQIRIHGSHQMCN